MLPVATHPCLFRKAHPHLGITEYPHGTPRPSWLAAPEHSQKQLEEEGQTDGHPTPTGVQPSASPSSPAAQRAEGDATGWHGEGSWKHAPTPCLVWAMCF